MVLFKIANEQLCRFWMVGVPPLPPTHPLPQHNLGLTFTLVFKLSYENEFLLHVHCHANQTHFHTCRKGYAPGLVFKFREHSLRTLVISFAGGKETSWPLGKWELVNQGPYPFSDTNFQDLSRTQIDFSRTLKFTLTPTLPRSQC